jgi:hypothetical protein
MRQAVQEVGRAIQRVNDPAIGAACLTGVARFLTEELVIGISAFEDVDIACSA